MVNFNIAREGKAMIRIYLATTRWSDENHKLTSTEEEEKGKK
jgi:hypothetical protein